MLRSKHCTAGCQPGVTALRILGVTADVRLLNDSSESTMLRTFTFGLIVAWVPGGQTALPQEGA